MSAYQTINAQRASTTERGRKPMDPAERRSVRINVLLTPVEAKALDLVAGDRTRSYTAREAILEFLETYELGELNVRRTKTP